MPYVLANTAPGSELRGLIVGYHVWNVRASVFRRAEAKGIYSAEFLLELAAALRDVVQNGKTFEADQIKDYYVEV